MNQTSTENQVPLLPYYVYVLIDPRDQEVFYCGKGQGLRAQEHLAHTLRQLQQGTELTSAKQIRLAEIHKAELTPLVLVIGRYETESEALAVEATSIRWFYGLDRLTNAIEGHGAETIRQKGNFQPGLEGVDIPARVYVRDGTFSKNKLERLTEVGAFDALQTMQLHLQDKGFKVRDFSNRADRAFDPGASNGHLGLLVRVGAVDFIISITSQLQWRLSIGNTLQSRTPEAQQQLERIQARFGLPFQAGEPKNTQVAGQGRYRDFQIKPVFSVNETDALVSLLKQLV